MVFENHFKVKVRGNNVFCDILRSDNLLACQRVLEEFVNEQGLDIKKIRILTGLVWLNSAPLHHYPYNLFLHYFGRLNFWKAINQE